ERGICISVSERVAADIPPSLERKLPPQLPELSQPHVLRHYTRLSQMVLGNNVAINIGLATATMKYSPPVHELLIRNSKMAELHPLEPEEAVQGILEIIYRCGEFLCAISGMHRFSVQPGGGAPAIFANALIVRAHHRDRGEERLRNEVITTVHSHPVNAAAAATAGYKVTTLPAGSKGYPDLDALKAAVSERTAALFATNPEDIGPELRPPVLTCVTLTSTRLFRFRTGRTEADAALLASERVSINTCRGRPSHLMERSTTWTTIVQKVSGRCARSSGMHRRS
ncbi:MAG: hypothetical protein HY646_05520, partial [Acidobacteria bacterium]|nr:hypothetical protein [Acidobacteriota bacterium]